ncbi:MAG: ABC transporter ATP-binding protein [Desulfobacter sp.]|nr:ABC transporter ATP-binding protein [Desulfobacter sp.]WDP84113.1 MAG: ABC transporter ATP-binding protein [Desulfobacter sp.]
MAAQVSIRNLSFGYHTATPVFKGINLDLDQGEVFCLLGPNGSGKSTFLKSVARLLPPTTGQVKINGENLSGLSFQNIAMLLGFVPQNLVSAFPFYVADVVVMGRANRPCNRLSGGEWQLVLIARALTQSPKILLLDEPTSHLDLGNQIKILETVAGLSRDKITIIMATHFPDHAFISADQAAILKSGVFQEIGPPSQVLTDETLKAAYGINVKVVKVLDNRKICIPLLKENYGKNHQLV